MRKTSSQKRKKKVHLLALTPPAQTSEGVHRRPAVKMASSGILVPKKNVEDVERKKKDDDSFSLAPVPVFPWLALRKALGKNRQKKMQRRESGEGETEQNQQPVVHFAPSVPPTPLES